jgi:hypothetical protein
MISKRTFTNRKVSSRANISYFRIERYSRDILYFSFFIETPTMDTLLTYEGNFVEIIGHVISLLI